MMSQLFIWTTFNHSRMTMFIVMVSKDLNNHQILIINNYNFSICMTKHFTYIPILRLLQSSCCETHFEWLLNGVGYNTSGHDVIWFSVNHWPKYKVNGVNVLPTAKRWQCLTLNNFSNIVNYRKQFRFLFMF